MQPLRWHCLALCGTLTALLQLVHKSAASKFCSKVDIRAKLEKCNSGRSKWRMAQNMLLLPEFEKSCHSHGDNASSRGMPINVLLA